MSNDVRATLIALLGPAVSGWGVVWVLLKPLLTEAPLMTFRYLIFDPAHLMIATGILISAICVPVAIEVATASEDEVAPPDFERDGASGREGAEWSR